MTTKGNLELRLAGETLCSSVEADGYQAYNAIVELALFYDNLNQEEIDTIKKEEFREWFKSMSSRVFGKDVSNQLAGGVPCEVIIDPRRRILLHNGCDDTYSSISKTTPYTIAGAINKLVNNYGYQVIEFKSLAREYRD